jgi:hypothetical protein
LAKKKLVHIVLSLLFLVFAIIQLNDPDPIQWFLLYFLVAGLFLYSNYKNVSKILLLVLTVAYTVYSLWYFSYFMDWVQIDHKEELFGKMVYEKPYLEGTREFLGLLIAAGGLFFLYKRSMNQ